jgi:hypothetical protein
MAWQPRLLNRDTAMQSLAELQTALARALTTGDLSDFDPALIGGVQPRNRVAIHLRHYEVSLTGALCDKFPALQWLLGEENVRAAARAYVRLRPPEQPCIAEYGGDFPQFLAAHSRASSIPYLASFGALEWAVGQVSIATEPPPCPWATLSHLGPEQLTDATLSLQPGLRYARSTWRIDELMTTYLSGAEPARFVLREANTLIEVRGARGNVRLARLDSPTFAFRSALAKAQSVSDAATVALDFDPAFDAGAALRSLAHEGLVAAISIPSAEFAP